MIEILETLPLFEKILYGIAAFTTVIFALQTLMIFFLGADGSDGDVDTDIDTDTDTDHAQDDTGKSFGWFSFKNLINFFLIFSWAGLSVVKNGGSQLIALLVATCSGIAFVILMYRLMKGMKRLAQDNTPKLKHAIGRSATVYLRIPIDGVGKVEVIVGGSIKVLDAISANGEIATGTIVKVIDVSNNQLIVDNI